MKASRTTGLLRNARFAAVAAVGAALAPASYAQPGQPSQENPQWLNVVIAEVKPGHEADFEDRVREMVRAQSADPSRPQAMIYQVESGHPNVFHIVTPRESMGIADTPTTPLPPEQMAQWRQRIAQVTESVRFFVARTYPQFSIEADPGAPEPTLLLLRTIQVAPGRQAEYEAWVAQRLMPVLRETSVLGHIMANGFVGDSPQNFYHAVPLANWAALDRNPMLEVLGEQGFQEFAQSIAGIAQRDEMIVLRPRTDLMGPQQAPSQAQAQAGQAQDAQAAARN